MTRPENKKPTVGLVAEVGCLRGDLSFAYRAVSPHSGALLQQQQMQAPILIQWLTGHFPSYSEVKESQFARQFFNPATLLCELRARLARFARA